MLPFDTVFSPWKPDSRIESGTGSVRYDSYGKTKKIFMTFVPTGCPEGARVLRGAFSVQLGFDMHHHIDRLGDLFVQRVFQAIGNAVGFGDF